MKKRILSLFAALVLMIGTLTTNVLAAPAQADVDAEIKATAEYLATNTSVNSITISNYKTVLKLLTSGVSNANAYVQAFVNSVITNNLTSEGKIEISGSENLLGYTYVLQVLARAGIDATNFNGYNLVSNFDSCLNSYNYASLKTMIDSTYKQYNLADLMYTVKGYANELNNSQTYQEMIKDIILSYYIPDATYGYGFDLWGWGTYSADDAGTVLVVLKDFYNTDNEVKEKVDASISFVKSQINVDGTISTDLSFGMGAPDIRPSSSSTALGLAFLSAFGDPIKDTVYTGLLNFKSTSTAGAYFANPIDDDDDPNYSTNDALTGLLTYGRMLSKSLTAYELTDSSMLIYHIVIQKINALPSAITLNDKGVLDEISALYNILSEIYKAKVTNYSNFENSLAAYNKLYQESLSLVNPSAPKTNDNSYIYSFILLFLSSSVFTFIFRKRIKA